MGYYEDQMRLLVHEKEKDLNSRTRAISRLPEGKVITTRNHHKPVFYRLSEHGGKKKRTVIKDIDELAALLRSEYLTKVTPADQKRAEAMQQCLKTMTECRDDDVILEKMIGRVMKNSSLLREMMPGASALQIEAELRGRILNSAELSAWEKAPYAKSDYRSENRVFMTSRGLMVRSKSEVIIAELLYAYGIPFRYEELRFIDGTAYAPDFTIMRADGSIVYWEHMGKVDSFRYFDRQLSKLRTYYTEGIVLWKNLIITFDDENGLLSAAEIRNKIETMILVH